MLGWCYRRLLAAGLRMSESSLYVPSNPLDEQSGVPHDRVWLRRKVGAPVAGDGGRLPTCQFLLPFHPSDGRGRLAADGRAGELRLVALADHVVAALDDRATWRD